MPEAKDGNSKARFAAAMAWLASFTDYEQLLHKVPARANFDLGRIERLLARLGNPHRGRPIAHVTGTKGKTSVTWMIDALLVAHGVRSFRYLSPHVERIHERLAVDGQDVDDDTFATLAEILRREVVPLQASRPEDVPTFFEALTCMGFLQAARERVDALVLEVGLGGRLDATNVVDPTVAVVTSIGLDHVQILGERREAIAAEKAGIFKRGRPAVVGLVPGDPAFAVLATRARELDCPLAWPGHGFDATDIRVGRRSDGGPFVEFAGSLAGRSLGCFRLLAGAPHQAWNAMLAITAAHAVLTELGREFDAECARAALAALDYPGRAEWLAGPPAVLLDGAHTFESIAGVASLAALLAGGRPLHAVVGLTRDRDPHHVFAGLVPFVRSLVATNVPTPRGRPATEVAAALRGIGPSIAVEADRREALSLAGARADADAGLVVVTGSLYLVGACRPLVRGATIPPWSGPRPPISSAPATTCC